MIKIAFFLFSFSLQASLCADLFEKMIVSQRIERTLELISERKLIEAIDEIDSISVSSLGRHQKIILKRIDLSENPVLKVYNAFALGKYEESAELIENLFETDPELFLVLHARLGDIDYSLERVIKESDDLRTFPQPEFLRELYGFLDDEPYYLRWRRGVDHPSDPSIVEEIVEETIEAYEGGLKYSLPFYYGQKVVVSSKSKVGDGEIVEFFSDKNNNRKMIRILQDNGKFSDWPEEEVLVKWDNPEKSHLLDRQGLVYQILGDRPLKEQYLVTASFLETPVWLPEEEVASLIRPVDSLSINHDKTLKTGKVHYNYSRKKNVKVVFTGIGTETKVVKYELKGILITVVGPDIDEFAKK